MRLVSVNGHVGVVEQRVEEYRQGQQQHAEQQHVHRHRQQLGHVVCHVDNTLAGTNNQALHSCHGDGGHVTIVETSCRCQNALRVTDKTAVRRVSIASTK